MPFDKDSYTNGRGRLGDVSDAELPGTMESQPARGDVAEGMRDAMPDLDVRAIMPAGTVDRDLMESLRREARQTETQAERTAARGADAVDEFSVPNPTPPPGQMDVSTPGFDVRFRPFKFDLEVRR